MSTDISNTVARLRALAHEIDSWAVPLREPELLRIALRELLAILLLEK